MSNVSSWELFSEFSDIVKSQAFDASNIDWEERLKNVENGLVQSNSPEDAYPHMEKVLADIGDGHSFLLTEQVQTERYLSAPRYPELDVLDRAGCPVGLIKVPGFVGTKELSESDFRALIWRALCDIDQYELKGWIVDLRANDGGNMWPMLAGLAPLFSQRVIGYFRDSSGINIPWQILEDSISCGKVRMLNYPEPRPVLRHRDLPVAVLTSAVTCSSGEAVVVSFRGRSRTRQFGLATHGLSTSNEDFELSNGSLLCLMTAKFVDSHNRVYGRKIEPHVFVASMSSKSDIELACEWIDSA